MNRFVRATAGSIATSLTWTSPQDGWVLGTARCGTKTCTDVIGTSDAGKTWKLVGTIHAPIPQIGNPGHGVTQIRFGTTKFGWSYEPGLYRTYDGSLFRRFYWLPDAKGSVRRPCCVRPCQGGSGRRNACCSGRQSIFLRQGRRAAEGHYTPLNPSLS